MLKKLLQNAGIVEAESASTPAPETEAPITKDRSGMHPKATIKAIPGFTPNVTDIAVSAGEPDQGIIASLNAVLNGGKNGAYATFVSYYETLDGLPEAQRVPMALKLTEKAGTSSAQIVASINERIGLLDTADADNTKLIEQAFAEQVTGVDAQITTFETEIESLKAQIAERQVKINDLTRQRAENEISIKQTADTYEASSEVVRAGLVSEKERIQRFLSTPVAAKSK